MESETVGSSLTTNLPCSLRTFMTSGAFSKKGSIFRKGFRLGNY